jgi:hypothetical protein
MLAATDGARDQDRHPSTNTGASSARSVLDDLGGARRMVGVVAGQPTGQSKRHALRRGRGSDRLGNSPADASKNGRSSRGVGGGQVSMTKDEVSPIARSGSLNLIQ